MSDPEFQTLFAVNAVERILFQIDQDILSSTFGCAHLAYWRDKTSEVADMRRQEAMLPLALLYARDYPSSTWKGEIRLKNAIEAMLSFWCRHQYPDGAMDEWYKGERGFAAVAFSTHVAARTVDIMRESISPEVLFLTRDRLKKTGDWLAAHNDLFKTNHQAVGVAALAWTAHVLQNNFFKKNAIDKLGLILRAQTEEGWFPEIGHMDIGYTFLTAEFVLMAMDLWGDYAHIEPFRKAFDFACEWIHPDLSTGKEYGICQNTYISRIAIILMSRFSGRAAYLRQMIEKESFGLNGCAPMLLDDLRLLRNAYQPFLAYDYLKRNGSSAMPQSETIPLSSLSGKLRVYDRAGLARFSCGSGTGIFAATSGGLVRFFGNVKGGAISDYGYAVCSRGRYATNYAYIKDIKINKTGDDLIIACPVLLVRRFIPSFLSRIILHIVSSIPSGSRLIRKFIDGMRNKKGTAINQSSVNLSVSKPIGTLIRKVSVRSSEVVIEDELIFREFTAGEKIFFLESGDGGQMKLLPISGQFKNIPDKITKLKITKRYYPGESWQKEQKA